MVATDADRSQLSMQEAFRQDIDAIALLLIDIFDLRFSREVPHLNSPLYRWLDFVFRFVPPRPRQVILSDQFPKELSSDAVLGLRRFLRRVRRGEDINPYQGRGLKRNHDSSGFDKAKRTDFLFASWGVLHFHLSRQPIPRGQYFSKPSDWLALCVVTDDQLGLVDVVRHPRFEGFSDPLIFETLARNWPDYVEPYRLRSVLTPKRGPTQDEIHLARVSGGNITSVYNGHTYIWPGGGYTSAGTLGKVSMILMGLYKSIDWLAQNVWDITGPYRRHDRLINVENPRFAIRLCLDGIGIFEESTSTFFSHPRQHNPPVGSVRWLSDTILPPWMLPEVLRHKDRFGSNFCGSAP